MASRFAWFLTPKGKTFSFGCMTAASVATFAALYLPHTFYIHKYKEVVAMYEAAVPLPLSERVRKRWDEVLRDLNLPKHEIRFYEPFTVFGFELFRAGSVTSRWGAIIGIPKNFTYTDAASVPDKEKIRIGNEPVNWNRRDAEQLLESIILTDDAQRYGIAKEVLMAGNNEPLTYAIIGSFMVSSTYLMCRAVNMRYNLYQRPFAVRSVVYLLGCIFSYGIWAVQKDMLNSMWEKEADNHLAQLNKSYSKGAVEFWSQMAKRNVALRTLLGPSGEDMYTPNGNQRILFRQPSLSIEARKKFFEDNLKQQNRGQESLNEDEAIPAPA